MDMLSYSSLSGALAARSRARAPGEGARRVEAPPAWRAEAPRRNDADAADLLRLARLDSQGRPPAGRVIVAIDRDVLVAAMSVESDGSVIADPFRSTAPIVTAPASAPQMLRAPKPGSQRSTVLSLRRIRARGATASLNSRRPRRSSSVG